MGIRYVGLDGDDTLWQNETRFQLTQTALRDLLRRHVPDADVDAHLAEVEMRNLRIYGYGVNPGRTRSTCLETASLRPLD